MIKGQMGTRTSYSGTKNCLSFKDCDMYPCMLIILCHAVLYKYLYLLSLSYRIKFSKFNSISEYFLTRELQTSTRKFSAFIGLVIKWICILMALPLNGFVV